MRAYEILERIDPQSDHTCKKIPDSQFQDLERFADRLLAKLNIDVEFTNHFKERMSDARNDPCIAITELQRLFKKIKQDKAQHIKSLGHDTQAVIKDLQRGLNIPAVIDFKDDGEVDIRMKTIMRKPKFLSSDPEVVYEKNRFCQKVK